MLFWPTSAKGNFLGGLYIPVFDSDSRMDLLWEFNCVFCVHRPKTPFKFFYKIYSTSGTPKDCAVPQVISTYFTVPCVTMMLIAASSPIAASQIVQGLVITIALDIIKSVNFRHKTYNLDANPMVES
jgi:hypothetical protein